MHQGFFHSDDINSNGRLRVTHPPLHVIVVDAYIVVVVIVGGGGGVGGVGVGKR